MIRVRDTRKGKYPYVILEDVAVEVRGHFIIVPAGYETDFASIPTRFLKRLLEPQRRTKKKPDSDHVVAFYRGSVIDYTVDPVALAAIVHDWTYSVELYSRAECDAIFLDLLRRNKVGSAYLMYLAVRMGGWTAWPHDPYEKLEDLALGRAAMVRHLEGSSNTLTG